MSSLREKLGQPERPQRVGRVVRAGAGTLTARVPAVRVGDCVEVGSAEGALVAQVVGFDGDDVQLLPFSPLTGVAPGASVAPTQVGSDAPDAQVVLGDVIDPLGRSLRDGRAPSRWGNPLDAAPPNPLSRAPIDTRLATGVRVIDGLLPLGVGQRVGLFAGSGVGKSTLLADLAGAADCDVCVVGLIGERGREVSEFVERTLGPERMARTTVVVATSDAPPMMRARAAQTATALAEQWRDAGKHCLLLVDSITRYARALREAALLSGEVPARRGYPASVFAELPRLLERAGSGATGAITAIYTVLVAGGDMEEPISDEVRGIVDGHWVLSRRLAERGHFPAIDVPASVSRVAPQICDEAHLEDLAEVRQAIALLAHHEDAVDLGVYEPGSNAPLDRALAVRDDLTAFLQQAVGQADGDPLGALAGVAEELRYA